MASHHVPKVFSFSFLLKTSKKKQLGRRTKNQSFAFARLVPRSDLVLETLKFARTPAGTPSRNRSKTNLERFTRMLPRPARSTTTVSNMILSELAPLVLRAARRLLLHDLRHRRTPQSRCSRLRAGYGYEERRQISKSFKMGEGLIGQSAKEKKRILLTEVPSDYVRINSGLGASVPLNIIVMPVLFEG